MFAKVFGQIFDSSIADDYNCRRMFMDLLVLADSEGVVDMTHDAIARRTNVPIQEVRKYIAELLQPDPTSRSKRYEGRRIVPIDPSRDWGWMVVNYHHYRNIRDEEARRSYFRDAKRKQRKKNHKKDVEKNLPVVVKDAMVDAVDKCGQVLTPPSASASASSSKKREGTRERFPNGLTDSEFLARLKADTTYAGIDVDREHGKMMNWCNTNQKLPSRRRFINWLNRAEKPMTNQHQRQEKLIKI